MVDIWLIFCIGITFLVILFHALVDRIAHPHTLFSPTTTTTTTPPGSRMVWQVYPVRGTKTDNKNYKNPKLETEEKTYRVVHATKVRYA